jgi:penicillin-binding protein-related factor A (putative recombinase)
MSEANSLTLQVINHIYLQGGYAWRAASVGVFDSKMGRFRASAKKGVADVLACFKGHLIAVEIKIGKDHLSDEQIGFLKNIEHVGGIAIVAKNFDDFKISWENAINNLK